MSVPWYAQLSNFAVPQGMHAQHSTSSKWP